MSDRVARILAGQRERERLLAERELLNRQKEEKMERVRLGRVPNQEIYSASTPDGEMAAIARVVRGESALEPRARPQVRPHTTAVHKHPHGRQSSGSDVYEIGPEDLRPQRTTEQLERESAAQRWQRNEHGEWVGQTHVSERFVGSGIGSVEVSTYQSQPTAGTLPAEYYRVLRLGEAFRRADDFSTACALFCLLVDAYWPSCGIQRSFGAIGLMFRDLRTLYEVVENIAPLHRESALHSLVVVLETASDALHSAFRDRPPIHLKKPYFFQDLGPLTAVELERYTWLVEHRAKAVEALEQCILMRDDLSVRAESSEGDFEQLPTELILAIFCHLDIHTLLRCTEVSRLWYVLANDEHVYKSLVVRDFPEYAARASGRIVWKDTYRFLSSSNNASFPKHGLLFDLSQNRLLWASCAKPPHFSYRYRHGQSVVSIDPSDAIRFMTGAHPFVRQWQKEHGHVRFKVTTA
eukprot:CAMPEP_0174237226 /NCGR_PEP_ID=MMETSP0417-20130205/7365_1 /TAXON_ID=242541 /ORGANISM="Mayorella sp, Strain BSH-02190019" /LENGTH=465 /DNA_ID=CAMNT_0015315955 /DNA_START=1 /DNA_END=1394 /DNA_ORIENTATION=-